MPDDEDIIYDVEVANLCLMLNKLPSEVMAEDPDWLEKVQLVAAIQAERNTKDGPRNT